MNTITAPQAASATAAAGTAGTAPQATEPAPQVAAPTPRRPLEAPILSNPAVRLDARTSLVVLEFYTASGDVRAKIPSERELRAYRMGQDPMFPGAPARLESST